MIRSAAVMKYIACVIAILAAYLIQDAPHLLPEVFGGKPILTAALAIVLAAFEKEIPAVILGALCGYFADGCTFGYYTAALTVTGYAVSMTMQSYGKVTLSTLMPAATVSVAAVVCGQFLTGFVFMGYDSAPSFFIAHYLSRIIYTLAFVPVFFSFFRRKRNRQNSGKWK